MKIVFLCRLYKPHVGGVEKHVEEISKILSKQHSLTIIAEQHDQSLPLKETFPEATVYRIPLENTSEKSKKWAIWQWLWQNRKLLYETDIIHIHDVFFWLLPVLPFLTSPKLFITFHGYEGDQPPGVKQIFWHKLAEWLTWGNICIGGFHRKWYHIHPSIVSYGGVASLPSTPVMKKNRAVFIGRLAVDTGIMDYITAAAKLQIGLDVYGDGPQIDQAKKSVVAENADVEFHGFVPNAARLLGSYKIAFISRYLGILEALIARVPVVAHFDSAIKRDYLTDTPFSGFITICANPGEIMHSFKHIVNSPKRTTKMLQSGYNWARDQTWDKLASQYNSLWQLPNH